MGRNLFYGIYLSALILFLLNASCALKHNAAPGASDPSSNSSLLPASKTAEGNVFKGKEQGESDSGLKQGKCVYGCPPAGTKEKRGKEEAGPAEGPQANVPLPGSSGSIATPDYLLGPEDVIEVTVWKNENLSRVVGIRPDGKISLPLIGDVQAAGLTTSRVRESIREKLREFKESPEVSVIVREINSLVVYITGEILHPGKLTLRSDTSVLQAIIMAGGFTQFASPNKIVLLRRVGGVETRKVIRYKDIVSGAKPEDDVILQRGDTIVVP